MFEKVSRSLKYDSNFFFDHGHMDTTVDHFTPLALRVRGNKQLEGAPMYSPLVPIIAELYMERSSDNKPKIWLT